MKRLGIWRKPFKILIMATKFKTQGKVQGQILGTFQGLTVTVAPKPAKRNGKDRLWLQIRQNDKAKKWRISTALVYARSTDIQFVDDPQGGGDSLD